MAITGENEVAVDNQLRRAERQNQSPVDRILESAESATNAISLTTGLAPIGGIAKAFGVARRFTSELGVATLSENLDHLGNATEAALSRVEKKLEAQGVRVDEIEHLLNGQEFLEGIKAATLQAQRTKDKKRLERMALILANGVAEKDLEPESLDDMMRAAVELKESDIALLGKICDSQAQEMVHQSAGRHPSSWKNNFESIWSQFVDDLNPQFHLQYRSSLSRMAAMGFLMRADFSRSYGFGLEPHVLLREGAIFYERLQEISTEAHS